MSPIGTLRENSLHAALKARYARPGDAVEAWVDGYWVDVVRGEQLIEIQTRHFVALKAKLSCLLASHPLRLVYPIAREKWIMRIAVDGDSQAVAQPEVVLARRKSPKRGSVVELFAELVWIAPLARLPQFSLEVLLIQEEEVWQDDGRGSWRRKGVSVVDRRLVGVLESVVFVHPRDYLRLLPASLPAEFTVRDLAQASSIPLRLAGRMAYSLREMGALEKIGKRRNAWVYTRNDL